MTIVSALPVVMLRVEHVDVLVPFYREALGLPVMNYDPGRILQCFMPGGTILEIGRDGHTLPMPTDRSQSPSTLIFETDDIEATTDRLLAHGGTLINPPFTLGTFRMAYIADPEGHLVELCTGLAERVRNAYAASQLA